MKKRIIIEVIFIMFLCFNGIKATTQENSNPKPCPSPECCEGVKGPSNCKTISVTYIFEDICYCNNQLLWQKTVVVKYLCCELGAAVIDNACYQLNCDKIQGDEVTDKKRELENQCESVKRQFECSQPERIKQ